MSKNNEKGKQTSEEEIISPEEQPNDAEGAVQNQAAPEDNVPADDSLTEEFGKLQEELKKQKELLLRTAAEYDNYRKRTDREKRAIYNDAKADTIAAILPIADSLEYAVKAQDGATEEYQKGLEMVNKQFQDALTKLGVTPMGEAGEEFNPEIHNAVAHIEDDSIADNTIVEVFQKGYLLGDKVIRHAMVKVAN